MINYRMIPPGNYAELLLAETDGDKETAAAALIQSFTDPKDDMHKASETWINAVIWSIWEVK